jgi:pyruvate/2-oxoglutarate dehydrogenase complex dihydrolipoamide acyltransferase (E2) component
MPKLGLTMTEGTIDEWKKKVGDSVQKGEILYSVATDKLTNDVEADADGVLLKILVAEGETVPCKTLVGWLGQPGEAVPDGTAPAAAAPAAETLRQMPLRLSPPPLHGRPAPMCPPRLMPRSSPKRRASISD